MKNLFFIKRKKTLAVIAFLVGSLYATTTISAQANFTSKSSGAWNVASRWTRISGNDADGIPDADDNVVIRPTDSLTTSAAAYCKTLVINGKLRNNSPFGIMETVEIKTGGILWQNHTIVTNGSSIKINTGAKWKGTTLPSATVVTLLIRGTTNTITVDGALGEVGTNQIGQSIRIWLDAKTTTINGIGSIDIARFQTNAGLSGTPLTGFSPTSFVANTGTQTVNIDINMDIENTQNNNINSFSLHNGSLGTGVKTMNILKGKTVKIVNPNGAFHAANPATGATLPTNTTTGGDMTYNIYGTLDVTAAQFNAMTTSNTTSKQGLTQKLTVNVKNNSDGTGGRILLGTVVRLYRQLATQAVNVNVESLGLIDGSSVALSTAPNEAVNVNGNLYSWFTLASGATYKCLTAANAAAALWIGTTNKNYNPLKLTFANAVVATVKISEGMTPTVAAAEWGINKTWNIKTSETAGLATINFGYNGTSVGTGHANSRCNPSANMQLLSYNATLSKWEATTATMATPIAGAGTDKQVTFSGLTMPLSASFVVGNLNVLAGAFQSLSAVKQAAFNNVSWSTESEDNCVSFTVEYTKNGIDFMPIGTVQGNGTTNVPHDYYFMDEMMLANIYRVRQNKLDGTSILSANRSVVQNVAKYYPATTRDNVRVVLPNANLATVTIKNATGAIVYTMPNILNSQLLNISTLAVGNYTILIDQDGVKTTGALVKQ
jgi:hypothetical protein